MKKSFITSGPGASQVLDTNTLIEDSDLGFYSSGSAWLGMFQWASRRAPTLWHMFHNIAKQNSDRCNGSVNLYGSVYRGMIYSDLVVFPDYLREDMNSITLLEH